MFLLFVIIIAAAIGLYKLIIDLYEEKRAKDKAIEDCREYYYNRYRDKVDIKTGVAFRYKQEDRYVKDEYGVTHIEYGDLLKVSTSGKLIENISETQRNYRKQRAEERRQIAISQNRKYYIYQCPDDYERRVFYDEQLKDFQGDCYPTARYIWADVETNTTYIPFGGEMVHLWNTNTKRNEIVFAQIDCDNEKKLANDIDYIIEENRSRKYWKRVRSECKDLYKWPFYEFDFDHPIYIDDNTTGKDAARKYMEEIGR